MKKSDTVIENIFKINLKIKRDEKLLVFTDDIDKRLEKISKHIVKIGSSFCGNITYLKIKATKSHGAEPPEDLWRAAFGNNLVKELKKDKLWGPLIKKKIMPQRLKQAEKRVKKFKKESIDTVIALSYNSTSHTRFRYLLTKICGVRYASMPIFEESMLKTAMTVDWNKMERRTNKIAERVNRAQRVEIQTPNGTLITFSIKGRKAKADTGIISRPGQFSNLPAGEVFLAPVEGTASGRLILEYAPTKRLEAPVILIIKKGLVDKIEGAGDLNDSLRKKFSERRENKNIAELGIGTNDKAVRPDNILESEKIFGTIHIALGDNSSFGGLVSTPFHQDFIFLKPTVTLINKDGKKDVLLCRGKLKRAAVNDRL